MIVCFQHFATLILADELGVDLLDAAERKLARNRERYPAGQVRGSAKMPGEY